MMLGFASLFATGLWGQQSPLQVVSLNPESGNGQAVTFTLTAAGGKDPSAISSVWIYLTPTDADSTLARGCMAYYESVSQKLFLAQDGGGNWLSERIGTTANLENSRCVLSTGESQATTTGDGALHVSFALRFSQNFGGPKNIYGLARDRDGNGSPWQLMGQWNVRLLRAMDVLGDTLAGGPSQSGVATGYTYRRAITIDHTKVPNTDQTSFPVLISGTYTFLENVARTDGRVQNSNGYDIIFTSDIQGNSQLDHEIESYNPVTGKVIFWVRVPNVSHTADTVCYMFYGNSAVTTSQENKSGVWSNNFKAVYHLKENPGGTAPQLKDSTSNAYHLTVGNVSPASSMNISNEEDTEAIQRMHAQASKQSSNPRDKIWVTYIGLLETWDNIRSAVYQGGDGKLRPGGFGHLGTAPAQLIIKTVTDVVVEPFRRGDPRKKRE